MPQHRKLSLGTMSELEVRDKSPRNSLSGKAEVVQKIGGGGFIPGIVFNPSLKGLAYARADIGGPYRLNSDDSWTPLVDWVNDTNWSGVLVF